MTINPKFQKRGNFMQTKLIITTISVAFLHGITSSLHCIGMCGPFAGTLNMVGEKGKFKMNLLYNLGRFIPILS
ncbi:DsbD family 2 domain protein [Leptospira kirschneri str. 200801774]|nr:DsbD family 2 domain protein [Leptospira kirschneri str. 200801774]